MMRANMLLIAVCMLSGCIGFLDKMTREVPTNLFLMNHEVCAVSIMKPGEKMVSAEIFSTDEGKRFELFPDKPRYIAAGDCLPCLALHSGQGKNMLTPGTLYLSKVMPTSSPPNLPSPPIAQGIFQ